MDQKPKKPLSAPVAVGEGRWTSTSAVARQVALQARGNVALQLGAFATSDRLSEERDRILGIDFASDAED